MNQVTAPNPSQLMGTMEVAGTPRSATHLSSANAQHAQARINDPGRRRQGSAPNGCDPARSTG
ncbi:hypothetical protein KDH83_23900 [Achromobacter sp. Marseille-Q0513]|nr:hypothetical protein [Achromobacter sp. Marseille-Q0513]